MRIGLLLLAFVVSVSTHLAAADFSSLLSREWEFELQDDPQLATAIGDKRYSSVWKDYSPRAAANRKQKLAEWIVAFEQAEPATLDSEDQLNRLLMLRHLREWSTTLRWKSYEMPINPHSGVQLDLIDTASVAPLATEEDYQAYLARLHAMPRVIDSVIEALRAGKRDGLMSYRGAIDESISQCLSVATLQGEKNPFARAVLQFPAEMPERQREAWKARILTSVRRDVAPAYLKLGQYLKNDYAPFCRQDPGIWALPDGDARYRFAVEQMTTTKMSPEAVYELGLKEVERIHVGQEQLAHRMGFASLRDLRLSLKANQRLIPRSASDLLALYRGYISSMRAVLPKMFTVSTLPRLEVQPMPTYSEAAAASAKYLQAPPDGSRPAVLLINTGNLGHRNLIGVESSAYHEGLPGHHLQISEALKLTIPEFRREGTFTAFTEGWALYAEGLGEELGFYSEPYSKYGRLSNELLRAIRLVVDTGIHYRHWTRQQVVDYFHANSSEDEPTVQSETDRYIVQPGQALAYKVGEQTILTLRREAQSKLGANFKLSEFHHQILGEGSIPLDVLRERISTWTHRKADGRN